MPNFIQKLVEGRSPYIAQPNGYTCQSTCIGMVLGDENISGIRQALTAMGNAGNPAVMRAYLEPRVKKYQFFVDASLLDARNFLDQGKQLITHGWFTDSGHVVKISGYEIDSARLSYALIVDDPWMEFDFKSGRYLPGTSGDDRRYSAYGMYAYCVASQSRYDAAQIYRRGELDSKRAGMWLHVITL